MWFSRFWGKCLVFSVLLSSCGGSGEQQVDTTAVQEEMARREAKRVMPEEIIAAAYQKGEPLAREIFAVVVNQYQENPSQESFVTYLQRQSVHTFAEDATIHWVSVDTKADDLNEYEQQIMEAYRYSQQQHEDLIDNVQRMGEDTLLYTHPITLNDSLQQMLSLPADTAPAFLGMWSIYLPQKAIIQGM